MLNKKQYNEMEKACKRGNKILLIQGIIIILGWCYIFKYIL